MISTAQSKNPALDILKRSDGSARYSSEGITVIAAVNGPVEVQRKDELPEEAALEVSVRPAANPGSIRERHFEYIITKALRRVIKTSSFPRMLIQVILQIASVTENDSVSSRPSQGDTCLELLPALLNASVLALLSASIPLVATMNAVLVTVEADGTLGISPDASNLKQAKSLHVLAFLSSGELAVVESDGDFDISTFYTVLEAGRTFCLGNDSEKGGTGLSYGQKPIGTLLRDAVNSKLAQSLRWI